MRKLSIYWLVETASKAEVGEIRRKVVDWLVAREEEEMGECCGKLVGRDHTTNWIKLQPSESREMVYCLKEAQANNKSF